MKRLYRAARYPSSHPVSSQTPPDTALSRKRCFSPPQPRRLGWRTKAAPTRRRMNRRMLAAADEAGARSGPCRHRTIHRHRPARSEVDQAPAHAVALPRHVGEAPDGVPAMPPQLHHERLSPWRSLGNQPTARRSIRSLRQMSLLSGTCRLPGSKSLACYQALVGSDGANSVEVKSPACSVRLLWSLTALR
jgi:hypothetical protein